MIRPLRRRHRLVVGSLALLLPPAFVAGVAARPHPARVASLPAALLLDGSKTAGSESWSRTDLWPGHVIRTDFLRSTASSSLRIDIREPPRPDTLLYWAAGPPGPVERLPASAILLGGLDRATALPIPPSALGYPGHLLLYSLADREVVATSTNVTFPAR